MKLPAEKYDGLIVFLAFAIVLSLMIYSLDLQRRVDIKGRASDLKIIRSAADSITFYQHHACR